MSMIILTALLACSPLTVGDEPTAPVASQPLPWVMDISIAKELARKEGKDILINFTGSDWCGWCKRLDGEVFSVPSFHESAGKQYIYLYLDFPRSEQAKAKVVDEDLNSKSREELRVNGFPTVILADSQMRPYARTGYQEGGPEKYLEHIAELRSSGEKIKALLSAKEEQQQGLLAGAFGVLAEHELLGYPGFKKFLDMASESGDQKLVKMVAQHRARSGLMALMNSEKQDFPALVKFLKDHPELQGSEVLNALWLSHGWLHESGEKEVAIQFLNRMLADPLLKGNEQGQRMIGAALKRLDEDPEAGAGHDHDGDGVPDH